METNGYFGVTSVTNHPDTFDLHSWDPFGTAGYDVFGDQEIRCRRAEMGATNYDVAKDWANPGCQSKNVYGP